MYLKQLDIIGFKSFADRTRLTFEPGMIAIVGPNGCGKSNVSDAIRWVLGEQRPTAIRCSKLVDVVFNGTDSRKPLGLAEVSITFADCEKELGTEYHEVTVTRRVYRSGEGEYFINKVITFIFHTNTIIMRVGTFRIANGINEHWRSARIWHETCPNTFFFVPVNMDIVAIFFRIKPTCYIRPIQPTFRFS